ncbi:TIR domain-containing protein [Sphingobacterium siyangense]|uniref:TIR domain-containing protein n=1 Tax=Sphingobacterium siyangense TaxID=459529 RepID=UPI002FD93D96
MKDKYTIFFSWQSDVGTNTKLIQKALDNAIKALKKGKINDIKLDINIDRDTKRKTGSPSISHTIFDKIDQCDVFICDVSLINNTFWNLLSKKRLTPNPNVLIELGYAIHKLGWDRIICMYNSDFGKPEDLPFDLRGHRISSFSGAESISDQGPLNNLVHTAVKAILERYPEILEKLRKNDFLEMDRSIYKKIDSIVPQVLLYEYLEVAVNDLFSRQTHFNVYDQISEFYKLNANHFINDKLNNVFQDFLSNYKTFYYATSKHFHFFRNNDPRYLELHSKKCESTLTEEEQFEYNEVMLYEIQKNPVGNETYPDSDRRVHRIQDELYELSKAVMDSYKTFIATVKTELLIS